MPLPLTVTCFSKIQIGFTFVVPAHPRSPGERAVKRVRVCTASSNAVSMSNLAWQQSWRRCPVRTRGKGRRLACSSWTPRWEHADVAGRLRSCTARLPARMLPLTPTTCRRALSQCPVPCRWLAPPAQRPSYLTCRNCRRSQLHGYLQGKCSRSQWSRG